ncbi:MAG: type II toxin-antitoxin system death-on-curing family toxin [Selenomonadaceae bacterium]|nr:type II toxin-antitoxin system death-on-curing family toxin [Selenomonadaceae bacterium]
MIYLTQNQVLKLHDKIINEFGGIHGIRNEAALQSALANPLQTFAGLDLYPSVIDKAVQLCFGIIKNHPFLDGNKRLGLHLMLILIHINGLKIDIAHDELIDIIFKVADGTFNRQDFLQALKEKIKES